MARADYGDTDEGRFVNDANMGLMFGRDNSYTLERDYDEFERIVLKAYESEER